MLFDFDGPLCHVFAGLPAPDVARGLATILGGDVTTTDPLEILEQSALFGPDVMQRVEDALISAEIAAVKCSTATPGGVDSIRDSLTVDLPVGIVSNNSAPAIFVFLKRWDLSGKVNSVVGRTYLHPEWMKPHVRPVEQALRELNCSPADAVFIGDSPTDIEVAAAVGMPCVAYANKPGKRARFGAMGATAVVDSMWEVDAAIRGRSAGQ
jgi:phosphoglycolate phosphatase-like HAD superfamily hydrolase